MLDSHWPNIWGIAAAVIAVFILFTLINPFLSPVRWTEEAKLFAEDAKQNDYFGTAVAIDADTAVVGSPSHETGPGKGTGAVYVYVRSDKTWLLQAKLLNPGEQPRGKFGQSVALDGNTLIIGTHETDAYVFTRTSTSWSAQGQLMPPNTQRVSYFGQTVTIDGDTAVVGARSDVYIFVRDPLTGVWSYQTQLKSPNKNLSVAPAVAIEGNTLVLAGGGVCIYRRNPTTNKWEQEAEFPFGGTAVALEGDTAVIGTSSGISYEGSVRILVRHPDTGVWSQQARLWRRDRPWWSHVNLFGTWYGFGASVAIEGNTVVIGAYGTGTFASWKSATYVFVRHSNTNWWFQQAKLLAKELHPANHTGYFGCSVSISNNRMIVGARQGLGREKKSTGTAYIFERVDTSPAP